MAGSSEIGLKIYIPEDHQYDTNEDGRLGPSELEDIAGQTECSEAKYESLAVFNRAIDAAKTSQDVDEIVSVFNTLSQTSQNRFFCHALFRSDRFIEQLQIVEPGTAQNLHIVSQLRRDGAAVVYDGEAFKISGENIPLPEGATLNSGTVSFNAKEAFR